MIRTASAAGRRPGDVAVTSITLPPGASDTVATNSPPSTSVSRPATSTAASPGVTTPRTWTASLRIVPPSSGTSSCNFTRGSLAGLGASPQPARAKPAARSRARERTRPILAAHLHVHRAFLARAPVRSDRDRDLELEGVLAGELLPGAHVQRERERPRAARRRALDVAPDPPALQRRRH